MLKVGDKVKVRDDLGIGEMYDALLLNTHMLLYAGKEATIVWKNPHNENRYRIDLDEGVWMWCEEMFEPVEIVSKDEFEKFMRS